MQTIAGTTAHIKVDSRFAGILSEDFGIDQHTIMRALSGEPQREAIALVEWAAGTDNPAKALIAWARKHRRGSFRKARRNMSPAEQRAALDRRAG
jgi:hypothetical protein